MRTVGLKVTTKPGKAEEKKTEKEEKTEKGSYSKTLEFK